MDRIKLDPRQMVIGGIAALIVCLVAICGAAVIAVASGMQRFGPSSVVIVTIAAPSSETPTPRVTPTNTPLPATATLVPSPTPIPDDGMVSLAVPAGEFLMGRDIPSRDDRRDAAPQHTVYLDAFRIDKTEVTNVMYGLCVKAGVCQPPSSFRSATRSSYYGNPVYNDYPVVYVSWGDAVTYCTWAGRHLPTEAEWEKAARGTDGRSYPWGNSFPDTSLTNYYLSLPDTTRVGAYPRGASPYGALDMAGNVWEWVADWYNENYYRSAPARNPQGPSSGQLRGFRGGSYGNTHVDEARVTFRSGANPENRTDYFGFRCAK